MTYFGFLALFLFLPISIFLIIAIIDSRRGKKMPDTLRSWPIWAAILLHVVIAVTYTTLWDNYLVATGVWWYDINLVTGYTIGYVPIEEYTFFIVQPILAGLWLVFLARRMKFNDPVGPHSLRLILPIILGLIWVLSVAILLFSWKPGTYLALELGWAIPPIVLQLVFGADILWRYRKLVFWTIVPATLYLSGADSLAIGAGTWTIDPAQSLNIYLGGILPIEEFIFFLLTNTLLACGVTLVLAQESHERIRELRRSLNRKTVSIEAN